MVLIHFFFVLQSNKGSCCSLGAIIVLPQGGYKVICTLGIPTNGLNKPFAELRLVQGGLDKLASCCCCYTSFFWSSVFKAGSLLSHLQRFTFAFWHWHQFLGLHALCMLCLCQSVSLALWPGILAQGMCSELACVCPGPPQTTALHPCKHQTAGCRDVGTMEKQKGWTPFWPTSGALNGRQGGWTRLSFSLLFYIVWMWFQPQYQDTERA